jgi:AraC-like DNA-binding protein
MVVSTELKKLGLHPVHVALGDVDVEEDVIDANTRLSLENNLRSLGFELLEGKKERIVEQIKTAIIELVHRRNDDSKIKHSAYLSEQLGVDYAYLSKVFSEMEGTTIEQYIILQKIEKVKELLANGELNLSEIAWQLGYSSLAALSAQFKKVTGLTPTAWKEGSRGRNTLDQVGAQRH